MKIAFISDTHLGYNWGNKELASDSFRQAREAFVKAMENKVDLIVHPGDIFDSKVPKPEVWVEALRLFSLTFMVPDSSIKPVLNGGNNSNSPLHFKGIPVVAIHGNHERRGGGLKSPVEALDAAGHLLYLHNNSVKLEKDGERVNIFGLGYVPESYVSKALKAINPKKEEDSFNIFVLHQNLKEFLPDEISFLSLSDLPRFDLVVNGHIHWRVYKDYNDWRFMMPGSTVSTQLKKQEAERSKGFFIFDTKNGKAEFIELESARPFIYKELEFSDSESSIVLQEVRKQLEDILSKEYSMKPIVKIKLKGSLKIGRNIDKGSLVRGFEDRAFIVIDNRLESQEFRRRIEELREMHSEKMGNVSLGISILRKKLEESDYSGPDIEDIFDPLVAGEVDDVLARIIQHYQRRESTGTSSQ